MKFDFKKRNTDREQIDDPNLDPQLLDAAIAEVNQCNEIFGGLRFTKNVLISIFKAHPQKSYRIIDLGCSNGAMLRYLKEELPEYNLELIGLDLSARSIHQAQEMSVDYQGLRFRESDIFTAPLEELKCDIVLCTLTLHHLSEEQIPKYLSRFQQMAKIGVLINDLHRHIIPYLFFKIFSPTFMRERIAIQDGLTSIASGFKRRDFKKYAAAIQCSNDQLSWKWSFRYLWFIPTHEHTN